MTVEKIEKDYKKKVERNRKVMEIHKDAYFLGMIAAICLKDSLNDTMTLESIKEHVADNMKKNGHEDRLEEVMAYITEKNINDAVPILAYRCFDYYDKRVKEMREAYEKRLEEAKVKEGPKPQKKKYIVKIHKKRS